MSSVLVQDTEELIMECKITSTENSPGCTGQCKTAASVKFCHGFCSRKQKCLVVFRTSSVSCIQSTIESWRSNVTATLNVHKDNKTGGENTACGSWLQFSLFLLYFEGGEFPKIIQAGEG